MTEANTFLTFWGEKGVRHFFFFFALRTPLGLLLKTGLEELFLKLWFVK